MSDLSLRHVLHDNMERAMIGKPPIVPSIVVHVVKNCKVTAKNEMEAVMIAMRVKCELLSAYEKANGLFSAPLISVSIFKEVGKIEKDTWRVIAREMQKIG